MTCTGTLGLSETCVFGFVMGVPVPLINVAYALVQVDVSCVDMARKHQQQLLGTSSRAATQFT